MTFPTLNDEQNRKQRSLPLWQWQEFKKCCLSKEQQRYVQKRSVAGRRKDETDDFFEDLPAEPAGLGDENEAMEASAQSRLELENEPFVFSRKLLEDTVSRMARKLFSLDATTTLGTLHAIYWFAEYLLQHQAYLRAGVCGYTRLERGVVEDRHAPIPGVDNRGPRIRYLPSLIDRENRLQEAKYGDMLFLLERRAVH